MKKLIPSFLFIYILLGLFFKSIACEFKIGWEDWSPYQFKKNDQITGLDIDVIKEIAKAIKCKVIFQEIPWKRQLIKIKEGKIDLAAAASKTPERQQYAHFSSAYRFETMSLFVKKERRNLVIKNTKELIELIKLDKFKLGILRGYYYGEEFQKAMKDSFFKSKLQEITNIKHNIIKCGNGRLDGLLGDKFVVTYYIIEMGLTEKVFKSSLDVNNNEVYIMLSKKSISDEYYKLFESGLKKITGNGTLKDVKSRYLIHR